MDAQSNQDEQEIPRNPLSDFYGNRYYHLFEAARGAIVAPGPTALQYKRIHPGDTGSARVLLLDVLPTEQRSLPFDLTRRGDTAIYILEETSQPSDQMILCAEGLLNLTEGELVIADEGDVVEALANVRDPKEIREILSPVWLVDPGVYSVSVWRHKKEATIAIRVCPAGEDQMEGAGANEDYFPQPVELEIGPELDLHAFDPADARDVIEEYCSLAAEKGFRHVRIIHGRGIGQMRQLTHAILEEHECVESFQDAPEDLGGAGATLVVLLPVQTGND